MPFLPFPLEGKATVRPAAETNFANTESVTFSPINPPCRVIGIIGIVGASDLEARFPKDRTPIADGPAASV
jgi:hypothetical protein